MFWFLIFSNSIAFGETGGPPPPPGMKESKKLLSPKATEQSLSLGAKMVSAVPKAFFVIPPGLVITNITVEGESVTLQWQGSDNVQPQTSLDLITWTNTGTPTTNSSTSVSKVGAFGYYRLVVVPPVTNPPVLVSGQPTWSMRIGGTHYYDTAMVTGLAVDRSSNMVIGGGFNQTVDLGGQTIQQPSGVAFPLFLAKYGPSNQLIWPSQVVFGSTDNSRLTKIVTDAAGDVYVCGYWNSKMFWGGVTNQSAGLADAFIVKYSGMDGSRVWVRTIGGTGTERANSLALDSDGNLVVAGQFNGTVEFGLGPLISAGNADIFLLKLNPATGATIQAQRFGGTGDDRGLAIAAAANGDVILVGYFWSTSVDFGGTVKNLIGGGDLFVARYNSAGVLQWVNNYGGNVSGNLAYIVPNSVAVNPTDDIAITGYFSKMASFGGADLNAPDSSAIFVAKYSSTGAHIWSRAAGGEGVTSNDAGYGVAIDNVGDVYTTGKMRVSWDWGCGWLVFNPITVDPFVLKLASATGACLWSARYTTGNVGAGGDGDTGFVVSASDQIVFGGMFSDRIDLGPAGVLVATPGANEGFLVKVNP